MNTPSALANVDETTKFGEVIRSIRDARGKLSVGNWKYFLKLRTVLELEGGQYGTLPTKDGRTRHQVNITLQGDDSVLQIEFVTATTH